MEERYVMQCAAKTVVEGLRECKNMIILAAVLWLLLALSCFAAGGVDKVGELVKRTVLFVPVIGTVIGFVMGVVVTCLPVVWGSAWRSEVKNWPLWIVLSLFVAVVSFFLFVGYGSFYDSLF